MKRKLKPKIEKILTAIDICLIVFLAMINDFELSALPIIIGIIALICVITKTLYKYGNLVEE